MRSGFDALEPRRLLASTFTAQDSDGDVYTIKVTGPGVAVINDTGGTGFNITSILLQSDPVEGTPGPTTKLSISVKKTTGDGRMGVKNILIPFSIASIDAPNVDLAPEGVLQTAQFTVGSVRLGDIYQDSAILARITKELTIRDQITGGTVQVDATGEPTGITLKARDFQTGTELEIDGRLKLLAANFANTTLAATLGAEKITLAQSSTLIVVDAAAGTFGSIAVKGALSLSGVLGTQVGSISATGLTGSFVTGSIGKIQVKLAMQALEVSAGSYGSVRSGSMTNVAFELGDPDPAGFAITSLQTGDATDVSITPGMFMRGGNPDLRIGSVSVGSWAGGGISASSIQTIRSRGDFNTGVQLLQGGGDPQAIRSMTVGGTLQGELGFVAPVGTIRARRIGVSQTPFVISGWSTSATIASIQSTGAEESRLNGAAAGLGAVTIKGPLLAELTVNSPDPAGIALGRLSAGPTQIDLSSNAGVGVISVANLDTSIISVGFLGALSITGAGGAGGNMTFSTVRLNGEDADGLSLKKATIKGELNFGAIRAARSIGSITADALILADIYAGSTSSLSQMSLGGFDPGSRIDALTLKRRFSPSTFAFDAVVNAFTLGKITINGRINTNGEGATVGFTGVVFGPVSLKDLAGATVKPVIPTTPQDFSPFAGSADFIFRVVD